MIKLVDILAQNKELEAELFNVINSTVSSSNFIKGDALTNFETKFARFSGAEFCVGTSNGTTALEISLRALGVGRKSKVITVAHTFFATAEAIYNVGAEPVFVDVNIESGLINIEELESEISRRIDAVIPVHIYGHLAEMDRIRIISEKQGIKLVEDAAQAHGAKATWGYPGMLSDAATFSFFPGKNLGAWGDGGAIVTNSEKLQVLCRKLSDHGRLTKYEHDIIGSNSRLDSIQAAILEVKLRRLQAWNERRSEIAKVYMEELSQRSFPVVKPINGTSWHLFVIRVANREYLQNKLRENGIETGIHYPIPLHKQPAISKYFRKVHLPNTEKLANEIISIPIHPHLSESNIQFILEKFIEFAVPPSK